MSHGSQAWLTSVRNMSGLPKLRSMQSMQRRRSHRSKTADERRRRKRRCDWPASLSRQTQTFLTGTPQTRTGASGWLQPLLWRCNTSNGHGIYRWRRAWQCPTAPGFLIPNRPGKPTWQQVQLHRLWHWTLGRPVGYQRRVQAEIFSRWRHKLMQRPVLQHQKHFGLNSASF